MKAFRIVQADGLFVFCVVLLAWLLLLGCDILNFDVTQTSTQTVTTTAVSGDSGSSGTTGTTGVSTSTSSSFPVTIDVGTTAIVMLSVEKPENVTSAIVTITAKDADHADECQIDFNGLGTLTLYGESANSGNDSVTTTLTYTVSAAYFVDGTNTLTISSIADTGSASTMSALSVSFY